MTRVLYGRIVAALFAIVVAGPTEAQPAGASQQGRAGRQGRAETLSADTNQPGSFKWWQSAQFQRDLGLSADQVSRIDGVFQASLQGLRHAKEELDRQEAELSRLIESDTEEAQVARQVDRVEGTRGSLNKMRTIMLLHMRQVLSPDQRVRFKALHEKWEGDRRRGHDAQRQN